MSRTLGLEPRAFFLPGPQGAIFTLLKSSLTQAANKSVVLVVPPLAEEMNKSRHMFSLLAERVSPFATTVLFDPSGTGDSQGDFAAATWAIWLDDLHSVAAWLKSQGFQHIHLLGLRLGALLAADYLKRASDAAWLSSLILWQPVLRGEAMLNQFLRLRVAANMLGNTTQKETTTSLRELARIVGFVEIAGYDLSSAMIQSLDDLNLIDLLPPRISPLHWFELVAAEGRELSPASQKAITLLQERGVRINVTTVTGESFWATQEITYSKDLLEQTARVLQDA